MSDYMSGNQVHKNMNKSFILKNKVYDMENLKIIIEQLITSKREGDCWDFKVEHHSNPAEFLHDILCLSNSLHKGDRFIIYGVSDFV